MLVLPFSAPFVIQETLRLLSGTRLALREGIGVSIQADADLHCLLEVFGVAGDAELTRFIKAEYHAEWFSYSIDEEALERAEVFDGKLVLPTNVPDFSAEEIVT